MDDEIKQKHAEIMQMMLVDGKTKDDPAVIKAMAELGDIARAEVRAKQLRNEMLIWFRSDDTAQLIRTGLGMTESRMLDDDAIRAIKMLVEISRLYLPEIYRKER